MNREQVQESDVRESIDKVTEQPSSAGTCMVCERHADKRYGGMGRYLVMCIDCWEALVEPA